MKLRGSGFFFLCILCASVANAFSLDREAFTFTSYDLNLRVEPEQQRLGVRGKITLRNDSATPQKIAVLQISSSLSWRSIKAGGKQLQFVSQPFTSDIDHTGALSEAIVTLPEAVAPKGTVDLEIAYEGVIVLDATRLTRIGTPEAAAHSADWDQISTKFTAVRGAGYIAWYPMATEAADLSEGKNLSHVVGRWKVRHEAMSKMHVKITCPETMAVQWQASNNVASCSVIYGEMGRAQIVSAYCTYQPLGLVVPTFVDGQFRRGWTGCPYKSIIFSSHGDCGANYADSADRALPFITEWFGSERSKAQTSDLADLNGLAFESGPLLLTPLTSTDPKLAGLAAAHPASPRGLLLAPALDQRGHSALRPGARRGTVAGRLAGTQLSSGQHRSALSAAEKRCPGDRAQVRK